MAVEHTFYVSELITTTQSPQAIWLTGDYRGNQFYVREQTGYGRTMTGFGVILESAVGVATAESMSQAGSRAVK